MTQTPAKKRQWGTEKNTEILPILHEKPSTLKMALSRIAILATIIFWLIYIFSIIIRQVFYGNTTYHFTLEAFSYTIVVSLLTLSSLIYLITRHGALKRFSAHQRASKDELDKFFSSHRPSLTVLVPSLNEEFSVIRKTIISAALQEYPELNIVLLIDDKPAVKDSPAYLRLEETKKGLSDLEEAFSTLSKKFKKSAHSFFCSIKSTQKVSSSEITNLAQNYKYASDWLYDFSVKETLYDHVDHFFVNQILRKLSSEMDSISKALLLSQKENAQVSIEKMTSLYNRLIWTFEFHLSSFQRKEFQNLSKESNKAMNLNTYISLMGSSYNIETSDSGKRLIPTNQKNAGLVINDSDFLLTLDADSMLLREYCLRLVHFLNLPENEKVAVTQTPYSSFRGAFSRIERLAGATTDIQHILHQGMSAYDATFWVGANAVIRKKALEDIVETETENGHAIKRYIQDRTVIEDTESSIDMAKKGWKLINYPERLSYSATPPDFGSLIVQRRRWANGGLIIFPKLLSYSGSISKIEFLLRANYLISIAWATFGLIFLLAFPYDGRLLSPLVILAALPYFLTMASDLKYNGYHATDIFRIYGFNLIMLPINLAGVIKSVEQLLTGKKIPFARTPKVENKTVSAPLYLLAPMFIILFSLFTVWRNVILENWGNAIFASFNASVALYAVIAYIGFGNILGDLWLAFVNWLFVEIKPAGQKKATAVKIEVDWRQILSGDYQLSGKNLNYDK